MSEVVFVKEGFDRNMLFSTLVIFQLPAINLLEGAGGSRGGFTLPPQPAICENDSDRELHLKNQEKKSESTLRWWRTFYYCCALSLRLCPLHRKR